MRPHTEFCTKHGRAGKIDRGIDETVDIDLVSELERKAEEGRLNLRTRWFRESTQSHIRGHEVQDHNCDKFVSQNQEHPMR